jgi:hypothetical protein
MNWFALTRKVLGVLKSNVVSRSDKLHPPLRRRLRRAHGRCEPARATSHPRPALRPDRRFIAR